MRESVDYCLGHADGYRDGLVIGSPIRTNGHTLERYLQVKSTYESAIFNMNPTDYQRGYADGLDEAAEML
jgi:hypothetical protein